MTLLVPPVFGADPRTCPVIAIARPVLVGLGLVGVVAGTAGLV